MSSNDPKADLHRYLTVTREALVWKLDGLSEHDVRRPLVPTATNLLGLVKHVAMMEAGYLGDVFGRPFPQPFPELADDAEPNADMWATADESIADVLDLCARVRQHSDAIIAALDLDAEGHVPWWSAAQNPVTLHRILVHVIAEINRHGGQADIVRELIDGAAGLRADNDNLPSGGADSWAEHRARLQRVADEFRET